MSNTTTKRNIIDALRNRGSNFRQVDDVQYLTRCPSCGDKADNPNTGHLYLRIDVSDNSPILYYCHKCQYHGVLTYETMNELGVDDEGLKDAIYIMNKTSVNFDSKNIANKKEENYDYELPPVDVNDPKVKYVSDRLGVSFTEQDLKDIKIITDFRQFIMMNDLSHTIRDKDKWRLKNLHDKYVGFLTNRGTHILFRDITEQEKFRWVKYEIISNNNPNKKVFYSLPCELDVMSTEPITINLAEGVMDILSVAYNLEQRGDNVLNICVCGKYYTSTILYLIHLGLIGENITLNIYSDNDHNSSTSIEHYRHEMRDYKYLFKEINIYYNLLKKDCGVPKEQIMLQGYRV